MNSIPETGTNHLSLPDPLTSASGKRILTPTDWKEIRRPEILELFRTYVYGRAPVSRPDTLRLEIAAIDPMAMNGMATLKRINIHFTGPGGQGVIHLTLFIPNKAFKPCGGLLLICNRNKEDIDSTRRVKSPFWPAERMIERGYLAAAFHYSDVALDQEDSFESGVFSIFDPKNTPRAPDAWAAVAAWAWGASRVMDYFETDKDIDETRIAVIGHSRAGKAALWCGAEDERFASVISNNSGCTGAALSRGKKGETIACINKGYPHWFCKNYHAFNDKEDELPVDQHQLLALIAPRPLYVTSASEDAWSDPQSEFSSCTHAGSVYRLFGHTGLETETFPKAEDPLHKGRIAYHLRQGKHDLTEYDWDRFMDFSDKE